MLGYKTLSIVGFFLLMISKTACSLQFVPADDSRLNQKSEQIYPAEIKSDKIQTLINEMLALSGYEADPAKYEKSGVLVGLAAPQIGEMRQIIIINTSTSQEIKMGTLPKFDVLINPRIIWESNEREVSHEGCFSVPEIYIGCPKRPIALVVEAYDREGARCTKRYEGSAAFVAHHEIDHLNGVRFPERLDSEKDLHILDSESELPRYRKEWKNWDKHASAKLLEQMRNGDYSELVEEQKVN